MGSSSFSVPDFPDRPEKGSHEVGFSSTIYIEAADFKAEGEKGYKRLTMDQDVGLKYAKAEDGVDGLVLRVTKVVSDKEIDVEVSGACPVGHLNQKGISMGAEMG